MITKQKKVMKKILAVIFTSIVVFSGLFLFLYQNDNKYTHKDLQPIAGILLLNEQDLAHRGTYFLTHGWQFYPDVLLSPEDFANGSLPDTFFQTVSIGQYNTFSLSDSRRNPTGSATYRLLLHLPKEPKNYTLVLPEIYSSYRLYLGGEEVLSLGEPKPEGFTQQIGERTLQFHAGGSVELLIAVSNHSHFYSGLTFPPLFGLPEAVLRMQSTKLLIGMTALLLAGVCTLLALYLYCAVPSRKDRKMLFYFCTAFCVMLSYLYPVLFTYATIEPKPWYSIELLAIYGTYFFVVLLQNEICGMEGFAKRASISLLGCFCILALLYGLLPGYSTWIITSFGWLSTVVKILTALYLLCCAVTAAIQEQDRSKLLVFCTTAFGVSIFFDRIFPVFEPIYCGWLVEYGGAVMVLGLGAVLWHDLSEGYRLRISFTEEKRQLTRQVAMQKKHYLELTDKIEETIRFRHDQRHHLKTLFYLLEREDYDKLREYLGVHMSSAAPTDRTVLSQNLIVDAVLQYYKALCVENQIAFHCSAFVPPEIPLQDTELSILLSNLLENAWEAASHPECKNPFLSLQLKFDKNRLHLLVENSCTSAPITRGERFLSTKHEGYGIGTESVKAVASAHRGMTSFGENNGIFHASVMLIAEDFHD